MGNAANLDRGLRRRHPVTHARPAAAAPYANALEFLYVKREGVPTETRDGRYEMAIAGA